MPTPFRLNPCWLFLPLAVSLLTGCNSVPQNAALGAVIGTGVGAIIPAHDIEQVYYLGSFDPQEQVPPALYRVRVRGQASIISWMRFGSGWVPAELIDSLGSSVEISKKDGKIVMTRAEGDQLSRLTIGRRLMQFGPEGFREVPKDHRLVILMGSDPEDFFKAMDEALGAVSQAKIDQDSRALNGLLFEAITKVRAEKRLIEAQLEAAKEQFSATEGAKP
ncbi:hypothetical protein [Candidatus Nitrospira nitrificans]|uniref:Uncharacterized protein n=1 Tax=Candidatus Nitrospira nitrificans TaxID=1742973 RepID=A0A0S4LTJ9_9BACT|nr:hypothetical protein [Candidatus Nitrospira nitrificans]CUS39978.1 conserved exported hypothetical protein [Candidatus Nitrospira nitrificans]